MATHKIHRQSTTSFWSKVKCGNGGDCWPWMHATDSHGYGKLQWFELSPGHFLKASRVAFFLTHGWWPKVVRHECDNPPCCNPAHLLAGTLKDNSQDMVSRGRHVHSGKRPLRKLTVAVVKLLRAHKGSHASASRQFGVSYSHVYNIRTLSNEDL